MKISSFGKKTGMLHYKTQNQNDDKLTNKCRKFKELNLKSI